MSEHHLEFYIGGHWVQPAKLTRLPVIDPATEQAFTEIALGSAEDVDVAVSAARHAFESFSVTSKEFRLDLLRKIATVYQSRIADVGEAIRQEIGAPRGLAHAAQAGVGLAHLNTTIKVLEDFEAEASLGKTRIVREPIGVVGLITPWNWPINQIALKVAPAIAAGSTVVLKPSELSPISAILFAEILDEAGVSPGVFNLVNGDGPTVGQAIASHPDVDMVSFTGSTRAGILVAKAAADTIKRVTQELGGKSANIILPDADLENAVKTGVVRAFTNSGQSCAAPTRLFVHKDVKDLAHRYAREQAEQIRVGDPNDDKTDLGPVISSVQYDKIQKLIQSGIDEGATLLTGGTGRPDGHDKGYFIKPTVFGDVTGEHSIAREEIFGPVLSILTYEDEDDVVRQANDTVYGLAAYIQSGSPDRAAALARRLRAGQVSINYPDWDGGAPFGGYRQSGNGREGGIFGLHEFQEIKAVIGEPA